jgi:hypothetical protein
MSLRKDLDLFLKLIMDYLKNKESRKLDKIKSLYNSLIGRVPEDSSERQAINTLMSLVS